MLFSYIYVGGSESSDTGEGSRENVSNLYESLVCLIKYRLVFMRLLSSAKSLIPNSISVSVLEQQSNSYKKRDVIGLSSSGSQSLAYCPVMMKLSSVYSCSEEAGVVSPRFWYSISTSSWYCFHRV